jgi:hypothetical protein
MSLNEAVQKLRDRLRGRQHDYRLTFAGVQAQRVLADLAKFCRAHDSTFHPDARVAAVLEGRREVWLRVAQHLQLSDEEIWSLYNGRKDT